MIDEIKKECQTCMYWLPEAPSLGRCKCEKCINSVVTEPIVNIEDYYSIKRCDQSCECWEEKSTEALDYLNIEEHQKRILKDVFNLLDDMRNCVNLCEDKCQCFYCRAKSLTKRAYYASLYGNY